MKWVVKNEEGEYMGDVEWHGKQSRAMRFDSPKEARDEASCAIGHRIKIVRLVPPAPLPSGTEGSG